MNGLPNLVVMRSVSLYGLSDVRVTFDGRHRHLLRARSRCSSGSRDVDAARRRHARRGAAVLAVGARLPLRAAEPRPLGDGAADVLQDWVLERHTSPCPASPTCRSLGGETMQYQVLLDPTKLAGAGLSVQRRRRRARREQRQRRRRILLRGRPVLLRARPRPRRDARGHRQRRRSPCKNGTPVLVKDVGAGRDRTRAAARPVRVQRRRTTPSKASILMRTGEQAQAVLKRVEAKTAELNRPHPAART